MKYGKKVAFAATVAAAALAFAGCSSSDGRQGNGLKFSADWILELSTSQRTATCSKPMSRSPVRPTIIE